MSDRINNREDVPWHAFFSASRTKLLKETHANTRAMHRTALRNLWKLSVREITFAPCFFRDVKRNWPELFVTIPSNVEVIFFTFYFFARQSGVQVRVWTSYRSHRSSGYESFTELTEVPGIVARAYRTHRSFGQVYKCCTGTPDIVATAAQNLQKFRVRVLMS